MKSKANGDSHITGEANYNHTQCIRKGKHTNCYLIESSKNCSTIKQLYCGMTQQVTYHNMNCKAIDRHMNCEADYVYKLKVKGKAKGTTALELENKCWSIKQLYKSSIIFGMSFLWSGL